jgi:hypothetical protein
LLVLNLQSNSFYQDLWSFFNFSCRTYDYNFYHFFGNDTIDPYPLIPAGLNKILCITHDTYTAISLAYRAFRESIREPIVSKRLTHKHEPKPALQEPKYQRDYEPSPAIQVNECDYRRWCRVNEWFKSYGQGIYD